MAVGLRDEPAPPDPAAAGAPGCDDDHCDLCWQTLIDNPAHGQQYGWRTGENEGSYSWVCARWFDDFRERLEWNVAGA